MMKKIILFLVLLTSYFIGTAQYAAGPGMIIGRTFWFGAKIGSGLVLNQYQDRDYKDDYDFSALPNYNAGLVFIVSGSDKYGLYSELNFERRFRKVSTSPLSELPFVESTADYNFLTLPLIMQLTKKIDPRWTVHAGLGPQVSMWLGGDVRIQADELREFSPGGEFTIPYKVRKSPAPESDLAMYVPNANRFQYGLVASVGTMFDVKEFQRIFIDARLVWAHSNMGFNEGSSGILTEYYENVEFRQHSLSVHIGYVFGYDPMVARKGKSTIPGGKKKRK